MICTQRERSEPSIYIYRKQILEELKKKKAQPSSLSLGEVSVGDVLTVTRLPVSVRTHSAMRPVLHGAGRAARTQKRSVLFLTCCAARRRGVGGPAHVGGMAALIYGIGAWAEATACSLASSHAAWSLASWAPTWLSAVDVGGGFVGTRFAEALSWHRRELRRAWEGRVLAPTRHRRLSRQPWWGLSLHPSLVHAVGF